MKTFNLIWTRTAHDDYGSDREVTVGAGTMLVEASSREEVEAEIKKYEGAQSGLNEAVFVTKIEDYAGLQRGRILADVRDLLDPYHIVR